MKKKVKDGWHVIQGCDVYVEDGKVLRGTKEDSTAYPYRWTGSAWMKEENLTVAAFAAGVRRGTIDLK